jgi:hypothetical protein
MPFPFTLTGRVTLPGHPRDLQDRESLRDHIGSSLARLGVRISPGGPGTISFTHNPLASALRNRNLLATVSGGDIRLETESSMVVISYRLYFTHMCAISIVVVGVIGLLVPELLPGNRYYALALIWGWLYGGNYIAAAIGFRRFITRCAEQGLPPAAAGTRPR